MTETGCVEDRGRGCGVEGGEVDVSGGREVGFRKDRGLVEFLFWTYGTRPRSREGRPGLKVETEVTSSQAGGG